MKECPTCGRKHGVFDPCVTVEILEKEVETLHQEVLQAIKEKNEAIAKKQTVELTFTGYNFQAKTQKSKLSVAIRVIETARGMASNEWGEEDLERAIAEWDDYVARETEASVT